MIDLLSSQTRLGIYALTYCLGGAYLYRSKLHFFEDALSTLPVMTFCFACLTSLIQAGVFFAMGEQFFLSWEWLKSDLFWMPLQDAVYAFLAFTLPALVLSKMRRHYYLFLINRRRKT
jgi:hypothetical protein